MAGKYGQVAIHAADLAAGGVHPATAWRSAATRHFPGQLASQKKGCPRNTFLGLAEEGLIAGVPPGAYTKSVDNKRYAAAALHLLQHDAVLAHEPAEMWRRIMDGISKQHNHQMDVVASLWLARKFIAQ